MAAEVLRRHNLSLVLDRLHLAGPLRRSALTTSTGLNRSTIGDLIGELEALGLVEEGAGPAASGRGRPSPVVRARPEGATVIAVELTVDTIAIATVGVGGHVFERIRVERPKSRLSPERTLEDLGRLAAPLVESLPADHVLIGIGVAVAGVTRRADGFVHIAPNLGWHDVALAELVSSELGLATPVHVANDADLGALAEHRRGAATGVSHLIYIGGEVGIGMGVIVDGKPMLGSAGYAGEAGHMMVNPEGAKCRCGSIGCWESEAGEAALLRRVGSGRTTGLRALTAISERAAAGDAHVLEALAETGRWLGLGIANLINLFNPEVVVLGGLYHRFFPYLETPVLEVARGRALEMSATQTVIVGSSLGEDAPLIGAAELALSEILADPARVRSKRTARAG